MVSCQPLINCKVDKRTKRKAFAALPKLLKYSRGFWFAVHLHVDSRMLARNVIRNTASIGEHGSTKAEIGGKNFYTV